MTPSPVLTPWKRRTCTGARSSKSFQSMATPTSGLAPFLIQSSDESVSTRLVLPNLLAARQTAAWIVGMWGGVRKKKAVASSLV